MDAPKSKKWLDGKQQYLWPVVAHMGWQVETAGLVDLDEIYPKSGTYNYGPQRRLPRGTRVILKDIDEKGKAYVYNDNGVMMMPVELLKPIGR